MKLFSGLNEEQKMVRGCQKGRPEYQEALYNRFYGKMFGVCLRYTQNKESAEDVLQDGFIKVFRNIHKYSGKGSLEGWIRRIMVNTALELHRKHASMFPVTDLNDALDADSGHDLVAEMNEEEILRLIRELPRGYRTIFNLYAIEGYNHREISEMLGISEGTSKSQLARARQTLQENIHQLMSDVYGAAK